MVKIFDNKKNNNVKVDVTSLMLRYSVKAATTITLLSIAFVIIYILLKGIPHLTTDLFAWEYNSDNVSLLPALVNTVYMAVISLAIAVPIGIGSAIYLVEYAGRGNKFVEVIRITAETLSGIPSIVYGLFGSLFFVKFMGLGLSMLSGALTLSIMILPLIM